MAMIIEQTPNTEIYGDLIKRDVDFMKGRRYWSTDLMEIIPVGYCAICKGKVEPYPQKYYQRHNDNGYCYCFEFDAEHFYCEECAKKEAQKFFGVFLPDEVNRHTTVRNNTQLVVREYADGSLLEDITEREAKPAANIL